MEPKLKSNALWRQPKVWIAHSVRNKLLAMALGPLLVVFPLLVVALTLWGNAAYDRLLITKVRSDLAVARGYFDKVLNDVGLGTLSVAQSHRLHNALATPLLAEAQRQSPDVTRLLETERRRLGLDFLRLYTVAGLPMDRPGDAHTAAHLPFQLASALSGPGERGQAQLMVLEPDTLGQVAPELSHRLNISVVPTAQSVRSEKTQENRAMVGLSVLLVRDLDQRPTAILAGGVLLNQNLGFIDHINRIVYPEGSLPFGSQGTATMFLDDVRITTNVRLFQDQRAIGTRVSAAVRHAVLDQGQTWLDRAFVVNDWYVSAYEPLLDSDEQRIGMLYVGFLEQPFKLVRYAMLAVMALIFLAALVLAAVFSMRWARSIFGPVERMNRTMQRVEDGDAGARVGPLETRDELGALAGHLDELLDGIADKTQALERWGQVLDARVAERTHELAQSNESLRRAQQQLVKSEKLAAMGQLTASIAHEVNNPIAVMQGNLDLMRETLGTAAEPVRTEMKLLDEQVERMRLIVQQLLQYARPSEFAGYVEALDLNEVMRNSLVLVNHLLGQTRIQVEQDLQATCPVALNRQELQQVVINLLINAIHAMPHGGTLRLETRNEIGDSAWGPGASLTVLDTGPGLSPEVLQRLFQPFFTTRAEGNGLGLWISQDLVERYNGRISAHNRHPGPGAVFTVWLCCDPDLSPADQTPEPRH